MAMNEFIEIEVAYAKPSLQKIISLKVPRGISILEGIKLSGILQFFPEIDLKRASIGIFSKQKVLTDLLNQGDRIEIYRPLKIDPKDARRAKAKQKAKKN